MRTLRVVASRSTLTRMRTRKTHVLAGVAVAFIRMVGLRERMIDAHGHRTRDAAEQKAHIIAAELVHRPKSERHSQTLASLFHADL